MLVGRYEMHSIGKPKMCILTLSLGLRKHQTPKVSRKRNTTKHELSCCGIFLNKEASRFTLLLVKGVKRIKAYKGYHAQCIAYPVFTGPGSRGLLLLFKRKEQNMKRKRKGQLTMQVRSRACQLFSTMLIVGQSPAGKAVTRQLFKL